MKKIYILMLACCLIYIGCKKEDDSPGEIYGKWKLTESYQDPGDGSGKYEKVKGDAKFLIMDRSGQMSGDAIMGITSFKIIDSVTMEVYSSTYKMPIIYRYKVTASTLVLNPPCYEGCGSKFIRQ